MPDMKRREFITLIGGAAVAWPLAARTQQAGKLPTIGFLGTTTPSAWSQWVAAFVQRLRDFGWIEGRTIAVEYRWAEGRDERFVEIAAELRPCRRRLSRPQSRAISTGVSLNRSSVVGPACSPLRATASAPARAARLPHCRRAA